MGFAKYHEKDLEIFDERMQESIKQTAHFAQEIEKNTIEKNTQTNCRNFCTAVDLHQQKKAGIIKL